MPTQHTHASQSASTTVLLQVLPERRRDLLRLAHLAHAAQHAAAPTITVVGKYNHGKSSLLNALLGQDVFAVADRRETLQLQPHTDEGVTWLDAPGLDADVANGDDALAEQAIWLHSDIRLLVHAAKEGEFDQAERSLLAQLQRDAQDSQRQTLLVLTQIDQLADEGTSERVLLALNAQLQATHGHAPPTWPLHPVSVSRYRKGTQEGKRLLLEKSGIPGLHAALSQALAAVPAARQHEWGQLSTQLQADVQAHTAHAAHQLAAAQLRQQQQRQAFDKDLAAVLHKVHQDLQTVLNTDGSDRALEPDTFATMFKVTAGKQERARLQVAYSRACIEIDGVLIQHGVTSLPPAQRIEVESLNSVIVAVLGISVKFRDDLRQIFSTAGQAHLLQAFGRYFTLCEEQAALQEQITADAAALALSEQAGQALLRLAPAAARQAAN